MKLPQLYIASYWWADCDPYGSVVGFVPDDVESALDEEVASCIERNCTCFTYEDDDGAEYEAECACDIRWSGVHGVGSVLQFFRDLNKWERRDVLDSLRSSGVAHF